MTLWLNLCQCRYQSKKCGVASVHWGSMGGCGIVWNTSGSNEIGSILCKEKPRWTQFLYRYKLLVVWWCCPPLDTTSQIPITIAFILLSQNSQLFNRLYKCHFYIPHTREISDAYLQTVSAWVIPVVFSASCIALPSMFICSMFCIYQGSCTHDLWAESGSPVNFMWLSHPVVIIKCSQAQCWRTL